MLGSKIVSAKNENIDICVGETDARCHYACSIEIWLISSEDNRYRWRTRDFSCMWFFCMCVEFSSYFNKSIMIVLLNQPLDILILIDGNTSLGGSDFPIVQKYEQIFVTNFSSSSIISGFIWDICLSRISRVFTNTNKNTIF